MSTWFQVWSDKIEPVQVEKFTEHFVWIGGRRQGRMGWRQYFATWEEAHTHLLGVAGADLTTARLQLNLAQGRFGNIKGMKQPSLGKADG